MNNNNTEQRRNFLKQSGILLGISLTSIVLPGLLTSCSNSTYPSNNATNPFKLSDYPALLNVAGAIKITISGINNNKPLIVYRKSPTQFTILTSICTHLGCEVNLPDSSKIITCPCHGSQYYVIDGSMKQGPATLPLSFYNYSFDSTNNILTIKDSGNPPEIKLSEFPVLNNPGGAIKRTISGKNNNDPLIIIRESNSQFLVLSSVCKHQGCEVDLPNTSKVLNCPCHGSAYSAVDGSVLNGPTTQPLDILNWTFDSTNNILTIN